MKLIDEYSKISYFGGKALLNRERPFVPEQLLIRLLSSDKLFALWHLEEKRVEFICDYFRISTESAIRIIRLYDASVSDGKGFKVIHEAALKPEIYHWLFKGIKSGGHYVVEVGLLGKEHAFFPLLRSNVIQLTVPSHEQDDPRIVLPKWKDNVSTYTYYEKLEGGDEL